MAKRLHTLPFTLPPRSPDVPAYRWLSAVLREEILSGRLRGGARLPATRELAARHALARGTVVAAFEELEAEGYVSGTVGSGTFVREVLPDALLSVASQAAPLGTAPPRPASVARRSVRAPKVAALESFAGPLAVAFRANQPALDLFPTTLWAQVAGRRLRRASAGLLLDCPALGFLPLREAVADYLNGSRGVRCRAAQVAIVSGVQEALDLVTRLLVEPGGAVAMEDPGYVGAERVFAAAGVRIVSVPLDGEGMRVPGAAARAARVAYVTPAHQFPVGTSMSLARRLALLEWARARGAWIVEDDYDGEYRYQGRPVPALQGLDRHGSVIFAGSFSKVLFPALRLGYLVLPDDLVERFAAAKSIASRHAPVLDQAVLCDFLEAGHFGRHVRRMREVYAERRAVLVEGVRTHLAGRLELSDVEAGLQTVGWLPTGADDVAAARAASARGLETAPVSRYARRVASRPGLVLGFAAVEPARLRRGIRDLAQALGNPRLG